MKRLNKTERELYSTYSEDFEEMEAEEFLREIKGRKIEQILLVEYRIPEGQVQDILYVDNEGKKRRVHIYVLWDEPWSWSDRHWKTGDKTEQGIDIRKLKELRDLLKRGEEIAVPKITYRVNLFAEPSDIYRIKF